ncbi:MULTISPECIES: hypothetical protein [unclassified Desulfovibrio]|uniref:hypothetical protein n=1 Tax=unclassified Desulfovibrio TaxID=2593640 RepID=UPI002FDAC438
MGILGAALGGIGRMFVRKVTTVDTETGDESTRRQVTPFGKGSIIVIGGALLYHFILWPVLNYHFPHYGFPPIDAALLTVLTGMGM